MAMEETLMLDKDRLCVSVSPTLGRTFVGGVKKKKQLVAYL
jgi:hypothetical protein